VMGGERVDGRYPREKRRGEERRERDKDGKTKNQNVYKNEDISFWRSRDKGFSLRALEKIWEKVPTNEIVEKGRVRKKR
jgi:hypothetical protein